MLGRAPTVWTGSIDEALFEISRNVCGKLLASQTPPVNAQIFTFPAPFSRQALYLMSGLNKHSARRSHPRRGQTSQARVPKQTTKFLWLE